MSEATVGWADVAEMKSTIEDLETGERVEVTGVNRVGLDVEIDLVVVDGRRSTMAIVAKPEDLEDVDEAVVPTDVTFDLCVQSGVVVPRRKISTRFRGCEVTVQSIDVRERGEN